MPKRETEAKPDESFRGVPDASGKGADLTLTPEQQTEVMRWLTQRGKPSGEVVELAWSVWRQHREWLMPLPATLPTEKNFVWVCTTEGQKRVKVEPEDPLVLEREIFEERFVKDAPPWQLRNYIEKPFRFRPIDRLVALCYEHLLPIRSEMGPVELARSAIVAVQSGELRGINQPPYSATFRDFVLWLRDCEYDEPLLMSRPWILLLVHCLRANDATAQEVAKVDRQVPTTNGTTNSDVQPFIGKSCADLEITAGSNGLRVRLRGEMGHGKHFNLNSLGLRVGAKLTSLFYEVAFSSSNSTAFENTKGANKNAVYRLNKRFRHVSGVIDNLLTYSGKELRAVTRVTGVKKL
jgi:hypothetical protein